MRQLGDLTVAVVQRAWIKEAKRIVDQGGGHALI
jgi:hypothetical protein